MTDTGSSSIVRKDMLITCQTSSGVEVRGVPLRLSRDHIVFETYNPATVLRMSEALSPFTLFLDDRPAYSGKAVVANLIVAEPSTICEVRLAHAGVDDDWFLASTKAEEVRAGFERFFHNWGKTYRILPEFKVVIADIHSFLVDLRSWLEQLELNVRCNPEADRLRLEHELMETLSPRTTATIGALFDRFEDVARSIEPDLVPVHQAFAKRHLHPLILGAPFVYRTLQKPLGYAGDYEMVNMMMRDPYEGASLFGKAFNACALSRLPIVAHRNRLRYLSDKLLKETVRLAARGRTLRVLSIGCGPAQEIQTFMREQDCSSQADFTLVDFDNETLQHTGEALAACRSRYARTTKSQFLKRSVQQMLKQAARPGTFQPGERFDFVYCAGLLDYLPDSVCKCLIGYFYDLLAPEGVLLLTNVGEHPSRKEMEYFLEWHLIYRDTRAMQALIPSRIQADAISMTCEPAGVNILLEISKPKRE